jgi:2,4-dienoyl-CoA reductase-like NADH-dependent reductase (Old Yellow Enzyme family)
MSLAPLFTPYKLRDITLRNRFVMSPMQKHRPADLIPGPEFADYYAARTRGGVGLIVTQGTTMDHLTSASPFARLFPPAHGGWMRCAEAVRDAGGHIFMQLWHEGASREGGYGPSGRSSSGKAHGQTLTATEIEDIIDLFARSALKVKDLGFSGVEIHCGHPYLLGQFICPLSNLRDDDWGGDFRGRMKFPIAVTRAVRAAVGADFPISLRTSLWGSLSGPDKIFKTPQELGEYLLLFRDAGIDVFNTLTKRYCLPEFEESDLGYAGWVKKLAGMPAMAGGCVGLDTDLYGSFAGETARSTASEGFDELLRRFNRGDFDLVTVGRAVLTDAEWVNKMRDGRIADLLQSLTMSDIYTAKQV